MGSEDELENVAMLSVPSERETPCQNLRTA